MMGRWRWLAVAGICCLLASVGCGDSSSSGGPLVDPDAGTIVGAEGGVTGTTCRNSKDCPLDQVCDPVASACVQCVSASDCAAGLQCVGSHCLKPAAGCTNSLDCKDPSSPICDVSTGKCVTCVTSKDCPTNNDCTNHACKPFTACMNSLDCPTGQVCETTRMRCVECVGTNDCPMTSKCVANVCHAKCTSDTQCTPMGQLCELGQGICVQCIGAGDCKPDQYCNMGACAPDVCTANATSCMTNAVVTCRADGSGYGSPVSCGSQVCLASGNTASCKDKVCTPSVTACNPSGTQVTKCAADGLSAMVQDDCAGKNQICVAAQCVTGVCAPGKRYCVGNESRQCNVTGDSYTVAQVCQVTDYCDTATGLCKPKVCTANMPACNGRILTTCNADGSGFLVGGMDCSPKYCNAGACVDYLFHEDFEDGDFVGWTAGVTPYTRMVVATTAAAGTTSSLYLVKSSSTGNYFDGLYQTFAAPLTPSSISWYARVPTSPSEYAGIVTLSSTTGTTTVLARVWFQWSGTIYLQDGSGSVSQAPYTTNTWYHFELKNINWTNRTYNFYIDGVLLRTGNFFGSTGNSISRIDLAGYYSSDNAYFDQFDFLP